MKSTDDTPIDYMPVVQRWATVTAKLRKLILVLAVFIIGGSLAKHVTSPPAYNAIARLLPPFGEQDSLTVLSGAAGGYPTPSWWEPEDTNEANFIIIGMLRSDKVINHVIDSLSLMESLGFKNRSQAFDWLRGVSAISQDRHKLTVVSITTEDPELSAGIANAYLDGLTLLQRHLRGSQRSYVQEQVAKRIDENTEDLTRLESEFQTFKQEHGLVDLDSQATATVEALSALRLEEAKDLVARSADSKFMTNKHGTMTRLQARLDKFAELKGELLGTGGNKSPGMQELPDLQRQYNRYKHDISLARETSALLSQQLEVIRVFEAGSLPESTVLDRATVSHNDISMGAKKMMLFSIFLLIFLCLTMIAAVDLILHFVPVDFRELRVMRFVYRTLAKLDLKPLLAPAA